MFLIEFHDKMPLHGKVQIANKYGEILTESSNLEVATGLNLGCNLIAGIAGYTGLNFCSIGINNLLANGSFESNNPPAGWTQGAGATLSQVNSPVKDGTYALKLVADSVSNAYALQAFTTTVYNNQILTLGAWVQTTVANAGLIEITDGTNTFASDFCPNDGAWHWLTVSGTISNSATVVSIYMAGWNTGTFYFDGAMLVTGSVIPNIVNSADTQLMNETNREQLTTVQVINNEIVTMTYFLVDNCGVFIQEVGLWGNDATATLNSGTLFARALATFDNSQNSQDLIITWLLTLTAA